MIEWSNGGTKQCIGKVDILLRSFLHVVLFFVSPGGGKDFVYSPVNVNATIHCTVNNTNLVWEVDGLALDSNVQGPQLHARGLFQSETTSLDGVAESSVIVFGNQELNNNTKICCQSFVNGRKEKCATRMVRQLPMIVRKL